jgi:hypothetical protein
MLQRLPVAIFHAVRYPGKVPITFHRHLPSQVSQRMLAGIPRLALETLPKPVPVLSQFRPKRLDLFNRYSPTLGIKYTFFTMFIRSVLPHFGLM